MSKPQNPLAIKLYDAVVEKKSDGINVVLLVDGSGSIRNIDFMGPLKEALISLANALCGEKIKIALHQFSDTVIVHHSLALSNDIGGFITAVQNMNQISHGTATKTGMKSAINVLQNQSGKKLIILFTDGMPNRGEEPYEEIATCRNTGILVFSLGIGQGINETNLKLMCTSPEYCYNILSFQELARELNALKSAEMARAEEFLFFDVAPSKFDMRALKPLELKVYIRNNHNKISLPSGIEIEFLQNKYFRPAIYNTKKVLGPGQQEVVEIVLECKPEATVDDYPGEIEFKYTFSGIERKGGITLGTGFLRGDFITGFPINVLVFGSKGSGKSAFVNSSLTCLSLSALVNTFDKVGKSPDHITKHYQKIYVGQHIQDSNEDDSSNLTSLNYDEKAEEERKKIKLHYYDPWGDSTNNEYKLVTVEHLLNGQIKPGTHKEEVKTKFRPQHEADRIHAVIFILPITSCEAKDIYIYPMVETMKIVQNCGYDPIVVINRIDEIEQKETREAYFNDIITHLPVNPSNVYMHQNYHAERYRDIKIDLSTRKIMNGIINKANLQFGRMGGRNYLKNVLWQCETILGQEIVTDTSKPILQSSSSDKKVCVNSSCKNKGNVVDTTRCGECGEIVQVPQKKVCVTLSCKNKGNVVETSRCGECGEFVQVLQKKVCNNVNCKNKGNVVETTRCGECGQLPEVPGQKKVCIKSDCKNKGNVIETTRCGECGQLPQVSGQ